MMLAKTRLIRLLPAVLLWMAGPKLLACSVCFGESNDRMAQGMNMGIFALLLVITCVLAGVASFFVFIARRSSTVSGHGPAAQTISQNSTND